MPLISPSVLANLTFSPWDGVLIAAVSTLALLSAYLKDPRAKALMITLPVPFTVSSLALGRQFDVTNIAGLALLLLFYLGVRTLYLHVRWPIIPAIVASAIGYCLLGWLLAMALPHTEAAFWVAAGMMGMLAMVLWMVLTFRREPSHREEMPLWAKLLLVLMVTTGLVLIKQRLQGFMTLFPMVGVFAAYEGRHCLWTLLRQIPVMTLILLPVIIACRLLQPALGLGLALACGWVIFFVMLALTTRIKQWRGE